MSLATLLNIAALFASLVAVVLSATFATRQAQLARHANQLPMVDHLWIIRSPQFLRSEEDLWERLPQEDQSLRFRDLPETLRDQAEDICRFYQKVAYLVALGVIDERLAVLPLHYRVPRTWAALEPFIKNERAARAEPLSFYDAFEHLVTVIGRADVQAMSDQVFPATPPARRRRWRQPWITHRRLRP